MSRPWRTVSSPVFTMAVTSDAGTTRTRPRRRRAAPTPPARAVIIACRVMGRRRPEARVLVCKAPRVSLADRKGRDRLTVAVDATPLLGVRSGIGMFCHGALEALGVRPELDVAAFAVTWRRRRRLRPLLPPGVRAVTRPMPARPLHFLWGRASLPPLEWFTGPADVVHGTNFVVPPTASAARVVSVHDLTAVHYPSMSDPATRVFPAL